MHRACVRNAFIVRVCVCMHVCARACVPICTVAPDLVRPGSVVVCLADSSPRRSVSPPPSQIADSTHLLQRSAPVWVCHQGETEGKTLQSHFPRQGLWHDLETMSFSFSLSPTFPPSLPPFTGTFFCVLYCCAVVMILHMYICMCSDCRACGCAHCTPRPMVYVLCMAICNFNQ